MFQRDEADIGSLKEILKVVIYMNRLLADGENLILGRRKESSANLAIGGGGLMTVIKQHAQTLLSHYHKQSENVKEEVDEEEEMLEEDMIDPLVPGG